MNPSRKLLVLVGVISFAAGVAVSVSVGSRAQQTGLEIRAEKGTCKHGVSPDGMFYQSPYQTNNQLNPNCSAVSIAGMFDDVRGWRIGYHDFGTIRARDNRFMRRDDQARATTGPCDPATLDGCKGTMYGDGYMRGFNFALTKRVPVGVIDFNWEAGLLFFESDFNAWASKDEDGQVLYVREKAGFMNLPDLVLGGGLRWKNLYVMARKYYTFGHRAQSLTDFTVTEITVGIAIPLGKPW